MAVTTVSKYSADTRRRTERRRVDVCEFLNGDCMKKEIAVIYDETQPNIVTIGRATDDSDPVMDLSLLLAAVGIQANVCIQRGITEHKGRLLVEYMKSYIDKACADQKLVTTLLQ